MSVVTEQAHVTLSGDRDGNYVVAEERPDGALVLVPDTSIEAVRKRFGTRAMTPSESEQFWSENGPFMLPSDDEG